MRGRILPLHGRSATVFSSSADELEKTSARSSNPARDFQSLRGASTTKKPPSIQAAFFVGCSR
jgi:hypothetical protein